ncbi:MAG: hypothetical protein ABIF92_03260 [archaeon]
MDIHILSSGAQGHRGSGAQKKYSERQGSRPAGLLNKKAQINFGFIIAVLLLLVLMISVTTGVLNLLPSVKHDSKTAAVEARAGVISKLLLGDPGFPADWTNSPQRVGLLHFDEFKNDTVLGRLNSTKIDYINTLTYFDVADQLGVGNDTSFRVIGYNGSVFLDINNSIPGGKTSGVYVLKRLLSVDGTSYANVSVEVWE